MRYAKETGVARQAPALSALLGFQLSPKQLFRNISERHILLARTSNRNTPSPGPSPSILLSIHAPFSTTPPKPLIRLHALGKLHLPEADAPCTLLDYHAKVGSYCIGIARPAGNFHDPPNARFAPFLAYSTEQSDLTPSTAQYPANLPNFHVEPHWS